MKKYYYLAILVACTALFTGCQDDLVNNTAYNDGYLHFKFLFDKQGQWKDDDASGPQTRMMAPIEMTLPEGFSTPLYLHCVESSEIETAAEDTIETRGQRITGEAFADPLINPNAVKCFGLYAKVNGEKVLPITTKIQRSELSEEGGWQVKEQDLTFAGDGWPAGKTGDFYGFAPFPGYDSDDPLETDFYQKGYAQCISVNDKLDEPTIDFTMLPEEWRNKDILTASKKGVTQAKKEEGVELEFQHILTALKFNVGGLTDLEYKVGVSSPVTYYIKVKSIKLKGVYAKGTAQLGMKLDDTNRDHSTANYAAEKTYWRRDLDNTTGNCEAVINRTTDNVNGDANKLINTDEHCFMVLPQTTPSGAKVQFICDVYANTANSATPFLEDIAFEANIGDQSWSAGYSYTYKISNNFVAREYVLHSKVVGVSDDGTEMSFNVEGGTKEFDVTSTFATSDAPDPVAAPWHLEYRNSPTEEWTKGLPLGFTLETGGARVDSKSSQPGSTSATRYKLVADQRLEETSVVHTLENQYYGDDWYDLSTHGFGYGAEQTPRSTANCYVVQGWGNFKIPLVYGNAIKKGITNKAAFGKQWEYDDGIYDRPLDASDDTYGKTITYPNNRGIFVNIDGYDIVNPYINADVGRAAVTPDTVWMDEKIIELSSLEIENSSEPISETDDGPIKNSQNTKQYLKFRIAQENVQPGNCVLCVRDAGGHIMWSWHIWVTARDLVGETVHLSQVVNGTPYSFDVAPINLGWRVPDINNSKHTGTVYVRVVQDALGGKSIQHTVTQGIGAVATGGANIIYMNGRKDPFPNSSPKVKEGSVVYDGENKVTSIDYALKDDFKALGFQVNGPGFTDGTFTSTPTMNDIIKNPRFFPTSNANWFREFGIINNGNQVYMPWNINDSPTTVGRGSGKGTLDFSDITEDQYKGLTKTIHDPCPVGFVVPNFGLITMLQNVSGGWTKVETQVLDGITVKTPIPYLYNASTGLRFYLNGCRRNRWPRDHDTDENGDEVTTNSFGLTEFKANGYLHTGCTFGKGSYTAYIKSNGTTNAINPPVNNQYWVNRGYAIRPVKDSYEEVEAMGTGGKTKHFRQVNVDNVVLSETTATHLSARSLLGYITEYAEKWGISDISTNADFDRSVSIDGTSSTTTLNTIIGNAAFKEKKVYLRNVRVYFTYDDAIISGRTTTSFRVRIDPLYGAETHYKDAFVPTSEIGTWDAGENCYYHDFTPKWDRLRLESVSPDLSNWADIIPLDWLHNVTIKKVVTDIRMTYIEEEP